MRPPFAYYGGKQKYTDIILKQFPEHRVFVDLFGGSGAVLLAKEPAPIDVFNDIFDGVTNFYTVLRDRSKVAELVRLLRLTPYSLTEYRTCARTWQDCQDPVEKARRWFYVQANSFNGRFGAGLKRSKTRSSRGVSAHISSFRSSIDLIPAVAERFRNVVIENLDFRDVIKKYDSPQTLFYADPPYVTDTRNDSATYTHEMRIQDHTDLVDLALTSTGMWVISGYQHEVYEPLKQSGWVTVQYDAVANAASYNARRDNARTEVLWASLKVAHGGEGGHKTGTIG